MYPLRNIFTLSLFVGNKTKGRVSNRVFQENKACQIFWKTKISYPLILTAYQEVRNVRFSENLECFAFLKHPFWDSSFRLITGVLSISFHTLLQIKNSTLCFFYISSQPLFYCIFVKNWLLQMSSDYLLKAWCQKPNPCSWTVKNHHVINSLEQLQKNKTITRKFSSNGQDTLP